MPCCSAKPDTLRVLGELGSVRMKNCSTTPSLPWPDSYLCPTPPGIADGTVTKIRLIDPSFIDHSLACTVATMFDESKVDALGMKRTNDVQPQIMMEAFTARSDDGMRETNVTARLMRKSRQADTRRAILSSSLGDLSDQALPASVIANASSLPLCILLKTLSLAPLLPFLLRHIHPANPAPSAPLIFRQTSQSLSVRVCLCLYLRRRNQCGHANPCCLGQLSSTSSRAC